jgi:hypothetical protein
MAKNQISFTPDSNVRDVIAAYSRQKNISESRAINQIILLISEIRKGNYETNTNRRTRSTHSTSSDLATGEHDAKDPTIRLPNQRAKH